MNRNNLRFVPLLFTATILVSCGDDEPVPALADMPHQPYEEENVTVIGGDPMVHVATGQITPDGCLQVSAETCTAVSREGSKYCKTDQGPIDVIYVDGKIAEVVCYEDTDTAKGPSKVIDGDSDGNIDVPQQDNGGVITFDPTTDGKAIEGDITVDGNNVSVYGNGPDKSIINGDLRIIGNNARVRGLRIKGNVLIEFNTAALVFSVVEGNLVITSNNSLSAQNDVLGDLEVSGNNTILVGNRVGGQWQITGSGAACQYNTNFTDSNDDKTVQAGEVGDALTCS